MKKSLLFVLAPVAVGIAFASCNNGSASLEQPPPIEYAQPVVQPLKFSNAKKIDWDAIKAVKVNPMVTKLNWDKLPEQPYDTTGFKPFKYPVEEAKFDYNSLPEKDLDIDKLPSHPLKFKTYILPPPKLIKGAKLQFKNGNLFSFDFGEDQKAGGIQVYHLFTDCDGFLWIATPQGLYRYDGENLLLFLTGTSNVTFIYGMLQDNQGNIWIGDANNGIEVLDLKGGTLKKSDASQGISSNHVSGLMQDKQQRIWVTTFFSHGLGVNIIDPKAQTVRWLDKAQGISNINIAEIMQDKNDNILFGSFGGGVNVIDLKNKKIKYLNRTNGLKSDTVGMIISDHSGRLWIQLKGGLINVVDLKKKTIQTVHEAQLSYAKGRARLFQDSDGKIWLIKGRNEFEIDLEKRQVMHLERSNRLVSDTVINVKQDNQGQVWMGTIRGLNMIRNDRALIEHISKDSVNALMEDHQGLIWKSTPHGVDILNRTKETSRHLGIKEGLANDDTHSIKEINGGFIISTDSSLDILDTARKMITHLRSNNPNILVDNAGRIWYRDISLKGINLYDPKNKTIKHLGKAELQLDNYIDIDFMSLDRLGRVWISTNNGEIEVVDPNTGAVEFLNKARGFKISGIIDLLQDKNGNIWMYPEKGIYIADLKNQKLISFSIPQGLINDRVLSLLEHNGSIYAGTNQGITVITPPTEGLSADKKWHVTSYGLTKRWIDNFDGDVITKDGLYWSGDVGINVLDLSKKDTLKSDPYINGISVYDHPLYFVDQSRFNSSVTDTLWELNEEKYYLKDQTKANTNYALQNGLNWDSVSGSGNMPTGLQVPFNQNFIQFHYSNLDLTPHDTTFYRYTLLGVDKKWSDITSETSTVNYMNLQPGDYTFAVVSRDADNVWSAPAKFSFTVNPPWSRTWWAYIIYVSLIAGGIWCFVYYRSRQLVKEKRVLEQKVKLRTEEVIQQKEEIETQRDNLEVQRNSLEKTLNELKTTQTQLIQSEKMASLGELTAGIAHEIQNPLNFVNNFSEVNTEMLEELKAESKKPKAERDEQMEIELINNLIENEQKINHHGKRADSIVKGMLEHSRSRSGQNESTDLNVMADEYMRLSYHGLRAKDKSFNAELITHFDTNLPKIKVVQQDIGRVLLNLFNNAFYAVNEKKKTAGADYKPEISVTTSAGSGQVIIKVKDNGNGIPDAIKDKIMQPFFTTKPTGEGTGLGLSLTYDMVVKGHGGNIIVNSKEGEGSEFIISLPVG